MTWHGVLAGVLIALPTAILTVVVWYLWDQVRALRFRYTWMYRELERHVNPDEKDE